MSVPATRSTREGETPPAKRPIGLAHLTLLTLSPPELVDVAAAAGYDFVGIRLRAVTEGERPFPMHPGSPMLAETTGRLADTGIEVRDVEFLPLTAETGPADWLPVLECGAQLGASVFSVAGADADRERLRDTLAALTLAAAEFGIRPALEPISYHPVSTVTVAAELASGTGAAVLLDPLHLQRGGSTAAEVAALPADLIPVLQLCDAPLRAPQGPGDRIVGLQREARESRLPIGRGELPLAQLIAACPPGAPVSIEVPHSAIQSGLSALEWAELNLRAVRSLLAQTDTTQATEER